SFGMRVANWAMGSSRTAITRPSPRSSAESARQSSGGEYDETRSPARASDTGLLRERAARRFEAARACRNVSLKASALLLHVSRCDDSRLAPLHEREVSLLALPAC